RCRNPISWSGCRGWMKGIERFWRRPFPPSSFHTAISVKGAETPISFGFRQHPFGRPTTDNRPLTSIFIRIVGQPADRLGLLGGPAQGWKETPPPSATTG